MYKNLKKNAIANYIGQFYNIAIGIIILPFYLEYLGSEAYGLVGFFTMLMSWMMLLDMGLSTTLQREVARLKDKNNGLLDLKQVIVSVESVYILIAFMITIIIYSFSSEIATHWLDIQELSIHTVQVAIEIMAFLLAIRWFVSLEYGVVIGFEEQVWLNKYKIFINTLKYVGAFFVIRYISNEIIYFFIYQLSVGILEFILIKVKVNQFFNTVEEKVYPSFTKLQNIMPFAISIAYTAGIWLFVTQIDKLMLSHYLTLEEYGYFSLVIIASNGVLQMFQPIGQAILPRMTSLLSNGQEKEMIELYHKSTQVVAIVILSVTGIVAFYGYELLYAWTGNVEAAKWAAPILFWYALGNGFVALLSFQYYMQYAHGNLKYHVKGNTYFGFLQIGVMIYAVYYYGALGAGITWFSLQVIFLSFWPGFIHSKFAPGIHKEWLFKDIVPIIISSSFYLYIIKSIDFTFSYTRIEIFFLLIILGVCLLFVNILTSSIGRNYLVNYFKLGFKK